MSNHIELYAGQRTAKLIDFWCSVCAVPATTLQDFWNLGAAAPRWIAAEHRHLAPTALTGTAVPARQRAAAAAAVRPPWATDKGVLWYTKLGTTLLALLLC